MNWILADCGDYLYFDEDRKLVGEARCYVSRTQPLASGGMISGGRYENWTGSLIEHARPWDQANESPTTGDPVLARMWVEHAYRYSLEAVSVESEKE